METFSSLGEMLIRNYSRDWNLALNRNLLFNNVYWYNPYLDASGPIVYQHQCGPQGGRYRISKKGTCYKCKKMIGSYKQLDTIRGLKNLTEKEEDHNLDTTLFSGIDLSDNVVVNITVDAKT